MSEVLYRKYRPQTFAQVISQDGIKTILKNAVKLGRISHAYLFTGPRGVGKTTIARILAKAVNCLSPQDGEPDATCANCMAVQGGRFLDLFEIDAASYTGVDNIRDIIDHVKFAPNTGRYKVFIIDEVHMLSKAAFNALLKTLEEPPRHAIFILATTEIHKVPATIVSRSQRFDFRRVSMSDIQKLFDIVIADSGLKVSKEAQVLIAQAAEGSFRDALSILDQVTSFGSNEITLLQVEEILGITRMEVTQKLLDLVVARDQAAAVKFVKDLAFAGKDLAQFTRNFLEYLRLVMFVKMNVAGLEELGLTPEEKQTLNRHSEVLDGSRLLEIIKHMLEAYRSTRQSPVPEMPLLAEIFALTEGAEISAPMPSPQNQNPAPNPGDLDLGTIVDRWANVLERIKDYNHSLLSSLRLGRIVSLEGQDLTIAFPYNFHRDMIDTRKNRIIVEQVLEEIFGQKIKITVMVEREIKENGDLVSEAMKVLGE